MTKRSIFASILMASLAMFSFFLASADPEEGEKKFVVAVGLCYCTSNTGVVHLYAYNTKCHTGGDQPCSPTNCPAAPDPCE
jgi:hypothetical protein